jgi:hypothetical protein
VIKLWSEYKDRGFPTGPAANFTIVVGRLVDQDIFLHLSYYQINDKIVCFYDMQGAYAIWPLADLFFEDAAPGVPKTDATNFGPGILS